MKLLYAFPEPLPLPRARGVQVAYSVKSLAESGVALTLAYVPVGGQSPLAPTGSELPNNVTLLPVSRSWPFPFSRWHSVQFFTQRMCKQIEAVNPKAIYVRHLKLAFLLLEKIGNTPLIYEAHEVFSDTASAKKRERIAAMEQKVISQAAAVVCNSQATATRLTALFGNPKRLLVLPNGVNSPTTLPTKNWAECQRHIIYAGSFFGWKGVDDLIAAAEHLEGFRVTLMGGEEEQMKRLRSQLPTRGAQIVLLPRLPHQEVMQHLMAACIAVLPNRADTDSAFTSPIKLFEYMAAGCAIVASDLPAIREILQPDEAHWFQAGDAKGLAVALRAACDVPAAAQAAAQRLREKSAAYTWQARAEKLKRFVETTCSSAS